MIDPLEKARAFVAERRLTKRAIYKPTSVDWQTMVAIAAELRREPTRKDSLGFARLMRWQDIAEYLQNEFPELAHIKTKTLASAVCSRYHNAYPNKKTCIRKKKHPTGPSSSSPGSAAPSLASPSAPSRPSPAAGSSRKRPASSGHSQA